MQVAGTFTVKTVPQQDALAAGRMTLEKVFSGGLVGPSAGQMLSALGTVTGSGMYVAVETFTGTLEGRSGSFALAHVGSMQGGAQRLTVTVVPDSGTGELAGLRGTMTIERVDGEHRYGFDYEVG